MKNRLSAEVPTAAPPLLLVADTFINAPPKPACGPYTCCGLEIATPARTNSASA